MDTSVLDELMNRFYNGFQPIPLSAWPPYPALPPYTFLSHLHSIPFLTITTSRTPPPQSFPHTHNPLISFSRLNKISWSCSAADFSREWQHGARAATLVEGGREGVSKHNHANSKYTSIRMRATTTSTVYTLWGCISYLGPWRSLFYFCRRKIQRLWFNEITWKTQVISLRLQQNLRR